MTKTPPTSSVDVISFGCRLNALEGESVRAAAASSHLGETVVVNTCAVTAEAVRQARQTIRRVRRERPHVRIVATGCAAQIDPDTFAQMDEVDHILGNGEKMVPSVWQGLQAAPRVLVSDIMSLSQTAAHLVDGFATRTRAFVEVQNGCDHRCTFCIIPYGRGASRSVPMGVVVEQIARLVQSGHQEVVLTGVDLTSYGADLPAQPKLGDLVARILIHVPDLPRLRLSSIDSIEVDEVLMDLIAIEPRIMPHLHLSLQAGDDLILKRMKRRHLRDDAIQFCETVKALRPEMVFGADLIAGFPTETEDMFQNTLDIVEACELTLVHVFPFSPRQGTPAARMPQVESQVVKARAARLRALAADRLDATLLGRVGQPASVLVEDKGRGRTEDYLPARVEGEAPPPGALVNGRAVAAERGMLVIREAA